MKRVILVVGILIGIISVLVSLHSRRQPENKINVVTATKQVAVHGQ